MEIIPSILTNNQETFKKQYQAVKDFGAQTVQIDFVDGTFVEGKTLLPNDIDAFILSQNTAITLEAHLMVEKPEEYLMTLFTLGFTRVAAHYETLRDIDTFINNARSLGLEAGIALNPETDIDVLSSYVDSLDFALIMSVIPGAQGRPFENAAIEKISALKERYSLPVEIDGGVNEQTIHDVKKAGTDRIVIGSAIWNAPNPEQTFTKFMSM